MFSKSEIQNSKNVVHNAKLHANGDITIGDTIVTNIYLHTDYEKLCEQERILLRDIYLFSTNALNEEVRRAIDEKQKSLDTVLNQKHSFESYVIDLATKLTYSSIDKEKLEELMKLFTLGQYAEIEKKLDAKGLKEEQISLKNANKSLEEL